VRIIQWVVHEVNDLSKKLREANKQRVNNKVPSQALPSVCAFVVVLSSYQNVG
jgi:hypothetical protein